MPTPDTQSYEEMLAFVPMPLKPLIADGILLEGTKAIAYGEPKTFKSLLFHQAAFCFATGTPWIDYPVTQSRTLMIQGEISYTPFHNRTLTIGKNFLVPPGMLYFRTRFGVKLDREQDANWLRGEVNRIQPKIVILDPLYRFMTTRQEDAIARTLDVVDGIIENVGCTFIIITHARKPRSDFRGNRIDGGGAELSGPLLEAWADSIIRITGDITTDFRYLSYELRHAQRLVPSVLIQLDRNLSYFTRIVGP